ncbi:cryptochrome/deoxyribodipyrimidine photo-lyase family protein [Piscinibacter sakaiensis]|nr:cryptochrome/deoxyribodipyrimidine photo-lyase family protein [Piscinibacter sakaiensis]
MTPSGAPPQLVWFKRDLRVHDHAPLAQAAGHGPVLALYVYEPSVLRAPQSDACHLGYVNDCLAALRAALARRGCPLLVLEGECPEVLEGLRRVHGFRTLWSHEETGLEVTWARDRRVAAWCRAQGVAWHELPQNGVVRRLRQRDGWARRWEARMAAPQVPAPPRIAAPAGLGTPDEVAARHPLRDAASLGVAGGPRPAAERGGEPRAQALLDSFLHERGLDYRRAMASPLDGAQACSRLSAALAWGAISLRTVFQAAEQRRAELREAVAEGRPVDPRWPAALQSFGARLRWHCHFMQKLEDEPRIEFEPFSRACEGLRDAAPDAARLQAWCAGHTGYPMVDACMRALHAGAWINFRMRAMLVSFAAYHLWLDWRHFAAWLARQFIDFEPGIHYSQVQMQSGTTGINTVRIYSPARQALDQDPDGVFIRRWVPELAAVPLAHLAEPHTMPAALQRHCGVHIGRDYPAPIVDHASAYRAAHERFAALRRTALARAEAERVQQRHGSRRSGLPPTPRPRRRRSGAPDPGTQGSLWPEENPS